MKITWLLFLLVPGFILTSCGGSGESTEGTDTDSTSQEIDPDQAFIEWDGNCEKNSVNEFNNFLGLYYGLEEGSIKDVLGQFDYGNFSRDSSSFIYYYDTVACAPIQVWVNAVTSEVETIFIEILAYSDYYDQCFEEFKEYYKVEECDAKFFGLKPNEMKNLMGEPVQDTTSSQGVRSMLYSADNSRATVNFKFYPSQDTTSTAVEVNWFY